jgi:predicted ABC-class ATPase
MVHTVYLIDCHPLRQPSFFHCHRIVMLRPCGSILPTALLRSGRILQYAWTIVPQHRMSFGTKRRREFLPRRPQTKEAMARQKKMKRPPVKNAEFTALRQLLLHNLKDASYGRYRELESTAWRHSTHQFTLYVGTAQSDPYAPPTRCRLVIPAHMAQFPAALLSSRTRRMAVADYLWRLAHQYCQEKGNVIAQAMAIEAAHEQGRSLVKSWSGRKGGEVQIMAPTQYVMEQSAVQIDVTCQVTVNLPAKGRTILGSQAYVVLDTVLGYLVQRCLIAPSLRIEELQAHMDSIEDQAWLQAQLERAGLVAFVRDGAILPRRSGHSDRPLPSDIAVPFQAPEPQQVSFTLPRSGRTITGLGIRNGITLICGGGYHGKSTLLEALQTGVYLKVPGDGRDFCVTSPQAMKIRAEDGRWVAAVDISSFVKNVPLNKDTTCFSTADASGSTSQASNIVEVGVCAFGRPILPMAVSICR